MAETRRCHRCGATLPSDRAADGACPQCLFKLALEPSAFGADDVTSAPGIPSAASDPAQVTPGSASHPERIGPYRILQVLGQGGMGVVYLAEQEEPIRRRVALKLIKLGMDTRDVVVRFEAERQALALMDHPNIASVFDAGATPDGRPFFVMEYAPGVPLTEYCDAHRLGTQERLELFIKVCGAIQHAHQKGIIHRDLKPTNVLVVEQDGRPVPKVIDFGIAKATDQRLTERTLFTAHGLLVGTPEYMSPEQAELGAVDLDTRTDIYSLGVMLYELLVGDLPFSSTQLREAGYTELLRIIREEEPTRPSTRLTTAGGTANHMAERRHSKVGTLAQELRGDLDWITLKALEKDRARRYATVSELAADLTRYLKNEPVVARPPSVRYRMQKFVRRNRLAVTASGVVAIAVLAGLVVSSALYVRAERARGEAVTQRAEAVTQRAEAVRQRSEADTQRAQAEQRRAEADSAKIAEALARAQEASQRSVAEQALATAESNLYVNNIALADRECATNDIGRVDQLLAEAPARLRGWEWHYLSRLSHMEEARIPIAGSAVIAVHVDRSGDRFLALSADSRLATGDMKTNRVTRVIPLGGETTGFVKEAEFSPDALNVAATISQVAPVFATRSTVWDTATGAARWSLAGGFIDGARYLTFDPKGRRVLGVQNLRTSALLAQAGEKGQASLPAGGIPGSQIGSWDARSGTELGVVGVVKSLASLAFSADGNRIATGGQILDAVSGRVVADLERPGAIDRMVFSPDGAMIAGALRTGAVGLWNVRDGQQLWSTPDLAPELQTSTTRLAFTPDGRRLVLACVDGGLRVLDAASGTEVSRLSGHTGDVNAVAVTPDGSRIVSAGAEGVVHVWRMPASPPAPPVLGRGATDPIAVKTDPRLTSVMAATPAGGASFWSLDSLQPLATTASRVAANTTPTMILSPAAAGLTFDGTGTRAMVARQVVLDDGGKLVVGYEQLIVAVRTGVEIARLRQPGLSGKEVAGVPLSGVRSMEMSSVWAVALDPVGQHAAVGTLTVSTGRPGPNSGAAPSMNTAGSSVDIWSLAPSPTVKRVSFRNASVGGSLTFSPNGDRVILPVGDVSGLAVGTTVTYQMYDAATGTLLRSFPGSPLVIGAVFDPEGRRIAAVSGNNEVAIWDSHTGTRLIRLAGQSGRIVGLAFGPDGTRLAHVSMDGTIKVFEASSGRQLVTLRESSGPYSVREFIVAGKAMASNAIPTLAFSDDGTKILSTTTFSDPLGVRVRIRTWDGSPRVKR
jgi:eukaryotic-like serine/threonine-protein kinase